MNPPRQSHQESPGLNIHEILHVLYRHKWKITLLTLLGLGAAAAGYYLGGTHYESTAKVDVIYKKITDPSDDVDSVVMASTRGAAVVASEMQLMASANLSNEVARIFGPERLLEGAKGPVTLSRAAGVIRRGLVVANERNSQVIKVSFRSSNPEIVQPVLDTFMKVYEKRRQELKQQEESRVYVDDQLRKNRQEFREVEEKLNKFRFGFGITSLADAVVSVSSRLAKAHEELMTAETAKAEQEARLNRLIQGLRAQDQSETAAAVPAVTPAPPEVVRQHQRLIQEIGALRNKELAELSRVTADRPEVKIVQNQIAILESGLGALEAKHPGLTMVSPGNPGNARNVDIVIEHANLDATVAKIGLVENQIKTLKGEAMELQKAAGDIEDLERQKAGLQKQYEALQDQRSKISMDVQSSGGGIQIIEDATTPVQVPVVAPKILAALAFGGLGLGLVLALATDLVFDRSVKRSSELMTRLKIPTLLEIPKLNGHARHLNGRHALNGASKNNGTELAVARGGNGNGKSSRAIAPWDERHFIRKYAEVIRDRLILSFELKKIIHKPKLVAVTGLSGGEGTSTVASGLAASLSETGDGKVLLVDMNGDNPEIHPFLDGQSTGSLLDALKDGGEVTAAGENLYIATGESGGRGSRAIAPKRFYDLMPVLRASDFDYIIFDMPPVNQSSATLAVSGYMDKVVFVVEAERTDREALKLAHSELVAAHADVAAVLNKTRENRPKWARS